MANAFSAAVGLGAGCQSFLSSDASAPAATEAGPGAADGAGNALPDGADSSRPVCTGDGGPEAVRFDGFCIDRTPVTNRQYLAFLGATGNDAGHQTPGCSWNEDLTPSCQWAPAPTAMDAPVVCVDWCDARAYCEWAGKHLCGTLDGGAVGENDFGTIFDVWYRACSDDGRRTYFWGDAGDASVCGAGPRTVASVATCVDATGSVFDMAGNVEELVESDVTWKGAFAYYRSPSPANAPPCKSSSSSVAWVDSARRGFRCCSDSLP